MNSVDGNKKVKGIKRHVIVDKNSFLIVVSKRLVRSKDLGLGIITDTFNEKSSREVSEMESETRSGRIGILQQAFRGYCHRQRFGSRRHDGVHK